MGKTLENLGILQSIGRSKRKSTPSRCSRVGVVEIYNVVDSVKFNLFGAPMDRQMSPRKPYSFRNRPKMAIGNV